MKFYKKNKKVKAVVFSTEKPSNAGNSISKGYDNFVTRADKEITRAVNDVKNYEKTSPAAFYAITGGLAGAGIGALGNSLLNNDKKKSKVRKLLEGGIAGGILGAGAGAIGGGAVKLEREDAAKKQAIAALNNDLKFKNLTIDALQDGYLDLLDQNEALKKELADNALKDVLLETPSIEESLGIQKTPFPKSTQNKTGGIPKIVNVMDDRTKRAIEFMQQRRGIRSK